MGSLVKGKADYNNILINQGKILKADFCYHCQGINADYGE